LKTDAWEPETYSRFAAERSQPFLDLLDLVTRIPGGRAVDLGCGSGELTAELHRAAGAAETLGIDLSDSMLAKAAPHASGGLRFEKGDIARFAPVEPFDLVFSNAALHWVPDHPALLTRLTQAVNPGGQLAFQVPDNFDHASHRAAEEVAAEEPFGRDRVGEVVRRHRDASMSDLIGIVASEVDIFSRGVPQHDDMTMLFARRLPGRGS